MPQLPDDQDSRAPMEAAEKPFPELTVREVFASKRLEGSIVDTLAWEDYVLVLIAAHEKDKPSRVVALDAAGDEVTFNQGVLEFPVNSPSFSELAGKVRIYRKPPSPGESFFCLGDIRSKRLQKIVEQQLGDSDKYWDISTAKPYLIHPTRLQSLHNGELVCAWGGPDSYVFFVAKNDNGTPLAPAQWRPLASLSETDHERVREIMHEMTIKGGRVDCGPNLWAYSWDKAITSQAKLFLTRKGEARPCWDIDVPKVNNNICTHPHDPSRVFFCSQEDAKGIFELTIPDDDPSHWHCEERKFPAPSRYGFIRGFRIDPTGNFFLVEHSNGCNFLRRDTLQEVKTLNDAIGAKFDDRGRVLVKKTNQVVVYDINFAEAAATLKAQESLKALGEIGDVFAAGSSGAPGVGGASAAEAEAGPTAAPREMVLLDPHRTRFTEQFERVLQPIVRSAELEPVLTAYRTLCDELTRRGLEENHIAYVTAPVKAAIETKQKELAAGEVAATTEQVRRKLTSGISLAVVSEIRDDLAGLDALAAHVDEATRATIRDLRSEFQRKSAELFRTQGEAVEAECRRLLEGVSSALEALDSKPSFDDWMEFTFPQLKSRLGALALECPLEAADTKRNILEARRELSRLADRYDEKFKREYAEIRSRAQEDLEAMLGVLKHDIDGFIERLRTRNFSLRTDAEAHIDGSPAKLALDAEIAALRMKDEKAAERAAQELKVKISLFLNDVDRGAFTKIDETGKQMVMFGQTPFPKWEGKVEKRVPPKAELVFLADERTKGPGVTADKIIGDIGFKFTDARGRTREARLWEDHSREEALRYGSEQWRGAGIPSSYLSQAEYRKVKEAYRKWEKGTLKEELKKKRAALTEHYGKRAKPKARQADLASDEAWKTTYGMLAEDYARFCSENYIFLLQRIEDQRNAPPENLETNGKGYVPEWERHWTLDENTENYLEKMAQRSQMQLDLQESMLLLKGHAGSGKDVLVKMFCERTRRRYFKMDCSKWTTELELAEDIILVGEGGVTTSLRVPSIVLQAIQTPGAVMYFNEINAMPEIAQIFLHSLLDESRSMTLKTRGGKTIKADPSVIFMGSMNPGYPGTFDPQMATRSRIVSMQVDYPPLKKQVGEEPTPRINSSEALRMARGVASLERYTYDPNMEKNEFVRMWNRYVNHIDNGAPEPTGREKLDIDVILALMSFGDELRQQFIKKFEGTDRKALPVTQPFSPRETRRMAYVLNKMGDADVTNAEETARGLIEEYYLSSIDKEMDRRTIRAAITSMTSQRRMAA